MPHKRCDNFVDTKRNDINKVLSDNPKDTSALTTFGLYYAIMKEYSKAYEQWDLSIKYDKDYLNPYYYKIRLLQVQGKYDEAHKIGVHLTSNHPNDYSSFLHHGDTLFFLGETDKSFELYHYLENLDKNDQFINLLLWERKIIVGGDYSNEINQLSDSLRKENDIYQITTQYLFFLSKLMKNDLEYVDLLEEIKVLYNKNKYYNSFWDFNCIKKFSKKLNLTQKQYNSLNECIELLESRQGIVLK